LLRPGAFWFALTFATASLAAQQISAELEPARTRVDWTLGATLHMVHGTFKLKRGTLTFDPSSGRASGQIVVDVTSGESGNETRDRKMRREVLESQRYPEAVFIVNSVAGRLAASGRSHLEFQGTLRIHGADHEIALPADADRTGDEATATFHFVIPYVTWSMKNPSNLVLKVSDHVDMDVSTTVHLRN